MFCPRCLARVTQPAPSCVACGFTGEHTLAMFPGAAPAMEELMDTAGCWSEKESKFLREQLKRMRKRFPQIHWCLLSIHASEQMSLRLFNFWFFNASPVPEPGDSEKRAWTILLTYEKTLGQFAVMPGYQLEAMLSDDEWYDLLHTMKVSWREGGMRRAYRDFFRDAEVKLVAASKKMQEMIQRSRGR